MHIPSELIDADADKVVRRLSRHGYQAYLVGGCVRDLLLDREPKDFDVATSATPKEIRKLFRNCRVIGRRFTLAHIFFGPKIIETATFRANPRQDTVEDEELLIKRDNVFGSDTEDAQRRDFTMNGLFYDVEAEKVIDHVGGLEDLQARVVRTIGDPNIRFREDPVRMLRAIKFAARLAFSIGSETHDAIVLHRSEITKCAAPRVLEEVYRLLRGSAAVRSMELLIETGIAAMLSPRLTALLGGGLPAPVSDEEQDSPAEPARGDDEELWKATWAEDFVQQAAESRDVALQLDAIDLELSYLSKLEVEEARTTCWALLSEIDDLVANGEELSNSLLLAALSMPFAAKIINDPTLRPAALNLGIIELLDPLVKQLNVARRDTERVRQLLLTQRRLLPGKRRGKPGALTSREYFGEALLLARLHAQACGEDPEELMAYWAKITEKVDPEAGESGEERPRKRRKRRRGGRRRRPDGDTGGEAIGG